MMPTLEFARDLRLAKVRIALVSLEGLDWDTAYKVVAPQSLLNDIVAHVRQSAKASGLEATSGKASVAATTPAPVVAETAVTANMIERRVRAVRDMLRNGSYKPAGRAKPSSEYLLAAALEGEFPRVNPFVDAVNLASLKYLYPMSIFDADKAGDELVCRFGAAGESYVFNKSGQKINLEDLICICSKALARESGILRQAPALEKSSSIELLEPSIPIVNPVRDSMATKLFEGAKNAVVVIYAPAETEGADLDLAVADIAAWCGQACATIYSVTKLA